MKVEHLVWVVTGGCSGLGLACVQQLVKGGGYVAVLDMNDEQGAVLVSQYQGSIMFARCDVRSEEDVVAALAEIDKRWPKRKLGGLIHCGGVAMVGTTIGRDGAPWSLDVFREVIDINLNGTFLVASLVAAKIAKQHPPLKSHTNLDAEDVTEDRGVLLFTSSSSYQDGQVGQAAYAASKGGVASLVLPMARDLARYGIRVNAIAPSLFETAMGKNTNPRIKENLLKSTLFPPRFGVADEFALLALHFIENTYMNGQVVRLDGGTRMPKM